MSRWNPRTLTAILQTAPEIDLADYLDARPLIEFTEMESEPFRLKPPYANVARRRVRRNFYFTVYWLSALIPVWFWILVALHLMPVRNGLSASLILAATLWPLAYIALRSGARIWKAEEIVKLTYKLPQ